MTRMGPVIAIVALGFAGPAWCAPTPVLADHWVEELETLRSKILGAEKVLVDSLDGQKNAQERFKKMKELLALLKKEREVGLNRQKQLASFILELDRRREDLNSRIKIQKITTWNFLLELSRANRSQRPLDEKMGAPRRKLFKQLVDRGFREAEVLKVDLADSDRLDVQIQDEKERLSALFLELKEQEELLNFHRTLQVELIKEKFRDRLARLKHYRKLKDQENQVEGLIRQFNARVQFDEVTQLEKSVALAMTQGAFSKKKGLLPLPIQGQIVSFYGKGVDQDSKLQVFHKGIEIKVGQNQDVRSIFSGKVAFSGELPGYGKVSIVDHGQNFYSLVARLGALEKTVGEVVGAGDIVGKTTREAAPVYFEIRSKNTPVNPLQWVKN